MASTFETLTHCIFFDEVIKSRDSTKKEFSYTVEVNGRMFQFYICRSCLSNIMEGIKGKQHIVRGLFANDKIKNDRETLHWGARHFGGKEEGVSLETAIETAIYPKPPKKNLIPFFALYTRSTDTRDSTLVK